MSEDIEEDAKQICEYAVGKLNALPGDVVVVQAPADWGAEARAQFTDVLGRWANDQELHFRFLVIPHDANLGLVHTLSAEEIDKAGAGDWPHEGRSGATVGAMPDDSEPEWAPHGKPPPE